MKKCVCLLTAVAAMALTGCVSYNNSMPAGYVPLEEIKTTCTYDVIGDATGTATGSYLFGIIPIGVENKMGQAGGMMIMSPVKRVAVYNAIESVPTADFLLAPRFEGKRSSYVIYVEETVTVKGKAVRYNIKKD